MEKQGRGKISNLNEYIEIKKQTKEKEGVLGRMINVRNNRGITIITLAVTILIIIILAGVTINAALGDDGLLKQAQQAKNMAEESSQKESDDMDRLSQEYANLLAEDEEIEHPKGLTAAEIAADASNTYGAEVKGYTCSSNGVSKWRIFYADENNIYIIADDYIASEYAPTSTGEKSLNVGSTNYRLYFTNILNDYSGSSWIRNNTNSKAQEWLSYVDSNQTSTNNNIKAVAYLMDTNKWSVYAGSSAEYAIGGPTLELFCASYQDTHPSKYINNRVENSTGYYVKWSDEADSEYTYYVSGLTQDDYNSIYIKSDTSKALGMWLASPSAASSSGLFDARSNGYVYYSSSSHTGLGLRPLVCLKSSVQLKAQSDGTYAIVQ